MEDNRFTNDILIKDIAQRTVFKVPFTKGNKIRKYTLTEPLRITIYTEDNLFYAENESLIVVGTGNSISEAIDNLFKQIIHFYKYYNNLSWEKVTGDAIRLKKIYEKLFINIEAKDFVQKREDIQ